MLSINYLVNLHGMKAEMSDPTEVAFPEQGLSPADFAGSSSSIREIWGGMRGPILLIHSAWNPARAIQRIDFDSTDTLHGASLKSLGLNNREQAKGIVAKLANYGNLLIEGDMIATDHVLSVLRFLYDPQTIIVKNSWELGTTLEKVQEHQYFKERSLKKYNVVLVCGPLGNLVTALLLKEAKLSWLFDSGNNNSIRTSPITGQGRIFSSAKFNMSDIWRLDHGVFVRRSNPYNPEKRIYAMMGSHAYGTQGAAATACNARSAAEVVAASSDPSVESYGLDYMAVVEVRRRRKPEAGEFSDPRLHYKIVWPPCSEGDWEDHLNPSAIFVTQTLLRTDLLQNTLFLGSRPSTLIVYSLALSITIILSCALSWTTWKLPIIFVALILALGGTVSAFVALLMPPAKQK